MINYTATVNFGKSVWASANFPQSLPENNFGTIPFFSVKLHWR